MILNLNTSLTCETKGLQVRIVRFSGNCLICNVQIENAEKKRSAISAFQFKFVKLTRKKKSILRESDWKSIRGSFYLDEQPCVTMCFNIKQRPRELLFVYRPSHKHTSCTLDTWTKRSVASSATASGSRLSPDGKVICPRRSARPLPILMDYLMRSVAIIEFLLAHEWRLMRAREREKKKYRIPLSAIIFLTLSERMPPYSRHHIYSKKIECRRTGGKKKNSRLLLELKLKYCRFLKITTQKLPNFIRIATQILPFS